jgi:hypothetical protein
MCVQESLSLNLNQGIGYAEIFVIFLNSASEMLAQRLY